jgi:hypothetical protein
MAYHVRYIRYVYNRVILESASVRAASVSALGLFALRCPELRSSILLLLRRSLSDEDDEVQKLIFRLDLTSVHWVVGFSIIL